MRKLVALLALIVGSIVCWEVGSVAVAAQIPVAEELSITTADPSAIAITECSVADEWSPATGSYGARTGVTTFVYDAPAVSRVGASVSVPAENLYCQVVAGRDGVTSPSAGVGGTSMTSVVSLVTPNGTAPKLTNGRQFETLSSQPISRVTRSSHRSAANKQLLDQLEADPGLRQIYDDLLDADVVAHMRSGKSGLRNPPGTEWHHPTWDPDSLLLLRRGVHRHPDLQGVLHPGPRGSGGFAEHFGGP